MESSDSELRRVLVKITDYLSANELRKLKFIFADEIRREGLDDTTINGAIDFFQQLLDRNIIDNQNLSKLIIAFGDVGCFHAAQILKSILISYFYSSVDPLFRLPIPNSTTYANESNY